MLLSSRTVCFSCPGWRINCFHCTIVSQAYTLPREIVVEKHPSKFTFLFKYSRLFIVALVMISFKSPWYLVTASLKISISHNMLLSHPCRAPAMSSSPLIVFDSLFSFQDITNCFQFLMFHCIILLFHLLQHIILYPELLLIFVCWLKLSILD